MDIIRVGIIGVGNWARHGHLRVLDLLPQYRVVAVQARRREAAEAAAAEFAIEHVVGSVEELVALPDVDLVLVLNTAPQHAETVRAAIAARKHVYCEWPLTVTSAIAEELAGLARDAGVRHVVGLQRRLAPHNRYLRDLIAEGYVGTLRSVRMHVSMNYFQARRSPALRWTVPPENFSSVVAIYAGHFLDMLFAAVGRPTSLSALMVNQFPVVTIAGTGETIATTTPDQLVMSARLAGDAVLSVHIEGGKRNGSGVQIDVTGTAGDLRITNASAFGDVGDDYVIEGAHGDNLLLERLAIPASYDWLPESGLPSAVLELANLYVVLARDGVDGTQEAPSFDDAVWLHHLFDRIAQSSREGERQTVE
ncbi:Gfo/Idh/MocA family oxidoreductase [uncultured Sphingomonas sp.]|uniref:Gfo/Idh/MocA family protein n=1 Tax=uncultured Sphingomonas sp. TaxID=158754 RepID=UPI00260D4245|nr:Gfo/Idh/MocA family oxidoreductase [uncultured Sphingomonas sp.]